MAYVRAELKQNAKDQLKGNWGKVICAIILVECFTSLISGILITLFSNTAFGTVMNNPDIVDTMTDAEALAILPGIMEWCLLFTVASLVLCAPVQMGYYGFSIGIMRREQVSAATPFHGFKRVGSSIAISVLMILFVCLWSLLFLIPGIIKTYSYAMAPYIWNDDPQIGALEAITRSRKMMVGHKWEFFLLQLSFILWMLLSIVTWGLALFYVRPYMDVTFANFYERLKQENPVVE